jgi:hypothetical protein
MHCQALELLLLLLLLLSRSRVQTDCLGDR